MNDMHVLDVVVEDVARASSRAARRGRRRQRAGDDHVADVADAGVAAERERLARGPS